MKTKQIIIAAAVVGVAFLFYNNSKKKKDLENSVAETAKPLKDAPTKDLSKPSLKKGTTSPRRGTRPNERFSQVNKAISPRGQVMTKSEASAQSNIGVENAEFAFNGITF
jgi:hypothetical protein